MSRDELISAYGDGWYDGFLAAKKIAESDNEDIFDYKEDHILSMSEHAESESQIAKSA
ncbi:hypothetical protein [Agaribacter marinus]|jgi:hypothetical protein|uniref:Uncharacterized protein n=1 Tax=Agaribacter marinus TaxID=1431249 RepID=A0AA37T0G8_9ALTE|nr:hypothetical protein [Agaribacter marinus]GLR71634.1 hypothetical protein GCM10007852_25420 [Agaribacter marinus]